MLVQLRSVGMIGPEDLARDLIWADAVKDGAIINRTAERHSIKRLNGMLP
jgi:hypothetical protein